MFVIVSLAHSYFSFTYYIFLLLTLLYAPLKSIIVHYSDYLLYAIIYIY